MTTTVREIEAERAEKERLFNEQINNPTSDDIAEKGQLQIDCKRKRKTGKDCSKDCSSNSN